MLHWQKHRLVQLIWFKSFNYKGESVSLFLSFLFALFFMGFQPLNVLLYCMFAKKGQEEKNERNFSTPLIFPSVWDCGLLGSVPKSEYVQGSRIQPKEVESLNKYQCGDISA